MSAPGDKEPQRLPHQFPRLRGFVAPLQFPIHLRQMSARPQQRQRPEIFAHSPLRFPRDAIQALDVHARVPEQLVFIHATQAARVIGQDGCLAPAGRGAPPKAIAWWVWLLLLPGQTRGDGLAEPALEELGLRPFGDRQIVIFSDVAALLLREMGAGAADGQRPAGDQEGLYFFNRERHTGTTPLRYGGAGAHNTTTISWRAGWALRAACRGKQCALPNRRWPLRGFWSPLACFRRASPRLGARKKWLASERQ